MAWKKEKFKTLIEHKSGYTWSKEQETKFPEPKTVRVLTVTNVQKELDLSSELYLKDVSEADKVKKAVSKDWSIAVSSNGNRSRIGNAVYIKEDSEYLFASFLTAFKPKEDSDILPDYFFRWLTSHNIQERITAVSEGTTGLGNLDIRFLRNTEIEYPENPAEQTAIAIILSKVDEAIAATQNSIKAAEKLQKALMQNLLTGKLKPDGSRRTEDEFYEDEKFGKVPKGWKKEKFKTLIKHKTGYTWSKDQEIKFPEPTTVRILTVTNIQKELDLSSELYLKDVSEVDKIKKAVSKDWSIAVSSNGNRSRIGNAVYIKEDTEYLFASFLTAFKPKKDSDILSEYFFRWLTSHNIQGRITAVSEGTTGLGNLNIRFLRNIEITYPENQSEQADITDKVNSIEKITKEKQAKIQNLQRLKKSLLQNLLTGKVRLPAEFIAQFEEAVEKVNKTVKAE